MGSKQELLEFWRKMKVDEDLIAAFSKVPREWFVSTSLKKLAYEDHPLPTIRSQSISQPSTIMIMLKALEIQKGHKVLELGAGVGYQAVLLSHLVGKQGKVVSMDIIPELVQIAQHNAQRCKISNLRVVEADGSEGFPAEAPFDRAVITAACPAIPQPIVDQLKEGGMVVAPVGDLEEQIMVKGTKINGRLEFEFIGQFRFVPMRGKYGFKEVDIYYE